jgi:arginyl-tRNA synthetase
MAHSQEETGGPLVLYTVQELITDALERALSGGDLPPVDASDLPPVVVERPQKSEHGDYASNIALRLAKPMRMAPMAIAQAIAAQVTAQVAAQGLVASASAGPPGFVNVSLDHAWLTDQVDIVRAAGDSFGRVETGKGKTVQVEFVSVNPTGPLHVGHARGAVIGSGVAAILDAAGYDVHREYYVNDAGRQMDLFARSLYARYMAVFGSDLQLPEDGYKGEYVADLAREIADEHGDQFAGLPEAEAVARLRGLGLTRMLAIIRSDLDNLGVEMDVWFSETSLFEDGSYRRVKKMLKDKDLLVERDGALWFASTTLGEDKDNVIERTGGDPTYFASDIAYHWDKFVRRGFDSVIDVWGADHQGHIPRMKAVISALGIDPDRLGFMITQMVKLKQGESAVKMSKRSGDLITLKELVDEVGVDACRFFFLSRSPDSQMDFDMELAKEQSSENPVYYVQYGHARISGILRLAIERGIDYSEGDSSLLVHEAELALIRKILELPELVDHMAERREPHHLPHFAGELATAFHWFYQQCRVVSSEPGDAKITAARLKLVDAARVALARCLALMGMKAPERM